MSEFNYKYLSENVGLGYGQHPWWEKGAIAGGHPLNVYPGPVPIEEVRRIIDTPITSEPIVGGSTFEPIPEFKRIYNKATGKTLQISGIGYEIHEPIIWCHEVVEPLLDVAKEDGMGIATVLTLGDGRYSAVTLAMPDSLIAAEMEIRPYTVVATSADGSLATMANNGMTSAVCDNTAKWAQRNGEVVSLRHTSGSLGKKEWYIQEILGFHGFAVAACQRIEALALLPVSDREFDLMIEKVLGQKPDESETPRKFGTWLNKRQQIRSMYKHDERCANWSGSALGAIQTLNTWDTHVRTVKGNRAERQLTKAIDGTQDKVDAEFLRIIQGVLGKVLV